MKVGRKLFIAMTSLIISMGIITALVTLVSVWGILHSMLNVNRDAELRALSDSFATYYQEHGMSWDGVQSFKPEPGQTRYNGMQVTLYAKDRQVLYQAGTAINELGRKLGVEQAILFDHQIIAYVHYYDTELGQQRKLKYGLLSTVTFMLIMSTVLFVIISLLLSYWISRRLTAPLHTLIHHIDRLGHGESGVQAPVHSQDEYGRVTSAFNEMSSRIHLTEEARRNLVADVAHELRTPITIIQGQLDLVQMNGQPVEPEKLLPLQDELIRLTRLIDDLHFLSLAEARKLPLEYSTCNMVSLVQKIVNRVTLDCELKQQQLNFHYTRENMNVWADPHRMTQVLLNLLLNAVRYTPDGGRLSISLEEEQNQGTAQGSMLRITITDSGIGIAPEHLPFLFNRFYRTDDARTRNSGGMGLGLAIAKELVLAHHGTIDVTSVLGEGTSFVVRLPLVQAL